MSPEFVATATMVGVWVIVILLAAGFLARRF